MAKRFPLQPLLDYSQHRMDSAERALLMLRQRVEQEKKRLQDLLDYRQEYQQRLRGSATNGIAIHLLRDYQIFLAKIGQAIQHQEEALAHAEGRWNQAHEHWIGQRQKVKAYETLARRHEQSETLRQDKRDQRLLDEQALKQFLYNPDSHES